MNLTNYQEWRECIEVHCGIPLTPKFIDERLKELKDGSHAKTREFERLYGTDHLQMTIAWFEQAGKDAAQS